MKKRHLMKRYGLAAAILLFLLLWLGQQNATDNTVINVIPIEQRSMVYNHHKRLGIDSQSLEKYPNPRDFHGTKQQPSHSSEYHISSRNTSRSGFWIQLDGQEIDRSKSRGVFDKNRSEERSGNSAVGVLDKDTQRSQITDDVIELVGQRSTDGGVGNLDKSLKHEFTSSTVASVVDERKTFERFSVQATVKYHRWRLKEQPVFNGSAVNSKTGPRSFPNNNHNQSLNFPKLIFPTMKPLAARQQVSSQDDDKDASLILARQMALKNFVIADNKHSHVDQSANNSVGSKVSDTRSAKSNKPDQHKPLLENFLVNSSVDSSRKREIDELRKFAEVPGREIPDYDLPMLNDKNGRVLTSTQLPKLVSGRASTVSYLVSDKTKDDGDPKLDDDEVLADTDDVMSSAVVLGEVNPNRTYAVFSTTTENREALNFVFLLPLTALAWKRVGFDSIVIVVGPVDVWNSDELYHFVLSAVRHLDAVVVFLEPRTEKSVMISQVYTVLRVCFTFTLLSPPGCIAIRRVCLFVGWSVRSLVCSSVFVHSLASSRRSAVSRRHCGRKALRMPGRGGDVRALFYFYSVQSSDIIVVRLAYIFASVCLVVCLRSRI